jgi:single-strand DNA-binding protein
MNSINLVGRITKDLELKFTSNNKPVCEFNLAVNRAFTNQNGEKEADFITCQVWNGQAENLTKYQGKGSLIGVNGSLRVDQYQDKDGNNRYRTFVLANNIEFLGTKKETTEQPVEEPIAAPSKQSDPFAEFGEEITLTDDDLPF